MALISGEEGRFDSPLFLKRTASCLPTENSGWYPKQKDWFSQTVFFSGVNPAVSFRVRVFTSESCQFHAFVHPESRRWIQWVCFISFILGKWSNLRNYSCRVFFVEISLPRKLHGNTKTNCQDDVGGASNNEDSNPDPSISQCITGLVVIWPDKSSNHSHVTNLGLVG